VTNDINLLIFKDEDRAIREISSKSSYEGLEKVLEAVDQARVRMDANVNMELAVELLLLAMKEN
jgi:DNA polymerase-3 subunit delta'